MWSESKTTHGGEEELGPRWAYAKEGGKPCTKRRQSTEEAEGSQCSEAPAISCEGPLVRVSDSGRTKIIVLNVVGFFYDIRPLHNRREWGPDLVIHHVKDLNVKIKKITDCGKFLSMLCSNFDGGRWSPIEQTLLEVVLHFLQRERQLIGVFCGGTRVFSGTQ